MNLLDSQLAWPIIEKELYAVVQPVKKFEHILFGRKILLYCDHAPLQFIHSAGSVSHKLTRWSLGLMKFDIELMHVPGKLNVVADALSRL